MLPNVQALVKDTGEVYLSVDDLINFFNAAANANSMGPLGSYAYSVAEAIIKEFRDNPRTEEVINDD